MFATHIEEQGCQLGDATWTAQAFAVVPRSLFQEMTLRDRQGCNYDAYLPDPLAGWNLTLPGEVAADIADAETAIRDLNGAATTHVSLEGLARFLRRAESVASSKIEGLDAGARRLVEAEAPLAKGGEAADRVAVEVLGNIASMESAIELADQERDITLTDLLGIHQILMERSPTPSLGGVIREEQNWIGGSSYNPCSATFVPPPAEVIRELLEDLTVYVNRDEHPALVQAAIAHAQFETIHPFADGNGRAGRALIHIILRRRGVAPSYVPPISLVLATWVDDYISGLTSFRHLHPADRAALHLLDSPIPLADSTMVSMRLHDADCGIRGNSALRTRRKPSHLDASPEGSGTPRVRSAPACRVHEGSSVSAARASWTPSTLAWPGQRSNRSLVRAPTRRSI